MAEYRNQGRIDCSTDIDESKVKGKSVIVTGGANGIGEGYVRSFVKAGQVCSPVIASGDMTEINDSAFVTIGDVAEPAGEALASAFPESTRFVHCDVTSWSSQLNLFKAAISAFSRIDIVVANAGISGPDQIYLQDVNLIGVLYTTKLALHYFQRQFLESPDQETLLILQGSLAGYGDQHSTPQYSTAKWGLRGLMCGLRRTAWQHNTRVNYIAPWAVKTAIFSPAVVAFVESKGMEFALAEDASSAVMRFACGDSTGRTLCIVPRSWVKEGYVDYDLDDYPEDSQLGKAQVIGDRVSFRTKVAANKQ